MAPLFDVARFTRPARLRCRPFLMVRLESTSARANADLHSQLRISRGARRIGTEPSDERYEPIPFGRREEYGDHLKAIELEQSKDERAAGPSRGMYTLQHFCLIVDIH